MRGINYYVLVIITLLHSTLIFSQNRIILFDSVQNKPVSSAHIYTTNGSLVTVSSELGEFDFFDYSENTSDTIVVSHISYQRKVLSAELLDQYDTVFMNESSIFLNEVIVYQEDIESVVQEITKILRNESINFGKTFYRQVTFTDTVATEWIEAFYDISYSENGTERIYLDQARFAKKKNSGNFFLFLIRTFPFSH